MNKLDNRKLKNCLSLVDVSSKYAVGWNYTLKHVKIMQMTQLALSSIIAKWCLSLFGHSRSRPNIGHSMSLNSCCPQGLVLSTWKASQYLAFDVGGWSSVTEHLDLLSSENGIRPSQVARNYSSCYSQEQMSTTTITMCISSFWNERQIRIEIGLRFL